MSLTQYFFFSKIEKTKKKSDRKSNKKNTKKPLHHRSQVPTKGALKGFDGIKISIPFQDLNMPPNVSPPHQRQSQDRTKKVKESVTKTINESASSYKSGNDADSKEITGTPDIYEFQDDERPVTKGFRLIRVIDKHRSSRSGNEDRTVTTNQVEKTNMKQKHNDDDCVSADDQQNDEPPIKRWKGKGKGKGIRANNKTNEEIPTATEDINIDQNAKQRKGTDCSIGKKSVESKINHRLGYIASLGESVVEDNDRRSNDNNKTLRYPQSLVEPYDSDTEDQIVMPTTFGFVPDRNDESTYESDSSSPTPLLYDMKESYACSCSKETEHEENITRKDCSHGSCRYNNLNSAKNAVMGKIFKNNALRYDKSDDSPKEVGFGGPKPKEDMDKLFDRLLENTEIDMPSASSNKPSNSGPSSATYINYVNTNSIEKDISSIDDGFSSPNDRYFGRATKIDTEKLTQPTVMETFNETMKVYARSTLAPWSDVENYSYEDEISVAKLRKMKRRANKKQKSHHKRSKRSKDVKSGKRKKDTASSKRNSSHKENESGRKTKRRSEKKKSPSRNSDEGISTSHDISAFDIALAENIGVAVQRARRKCTVGKQNVLVEDWSSSESETEVRGRRTSAKNSGRAGKKERTVRRSRDSDESDEEDAPRAPPPRVRARAAPAVARDYDSDSDDERDPSDIAEQERHGWVVGRSCKKLVGMLVSSKKKCENNDDKEDDEDENENKNNDTHEDEFENEDEDNQWKTGEEDDKDDEDED